MTTIPSPPAGPSAALDALCAWLAEAMGDQAPVRVALPDGDEHVSLCVWPVGLLPDQGTRGGSRQPMRLRVRHLVVPNGPIRSVLSILDRVLLAAATDERYPLVFEPIPQHLLAVLDSPGRLPRPALLIDVPISVSVPVPTPARVRGPLRLAANPLRTIHGRVLGPGAVPLANFRVVASATGTSTETDARGEFVLPGQPSGGAVTLHLSGRGQRMRAVVEPETTEVVVIHCEFEEV